MQQTEFYHDTYDDSGCQLYDEYNKCCMLDRIEIIIPEPAVASYPWEKAGETICIDG